MLAYYLEGLPGLNGPPGGRYRLGGRAAGGFEGHLDSYFTTPLGDSEKVRSGGSATRKRIESAAGAKELSPAEQEYGVFLAEKSVNMSVNDPRIAFTKKTQILRMIPRC